MNKQRLLDAADWAEKNINPQQFDMGKFRSGHRTKPRMRFHRLHGWAFDRH
jgi:hypothetical protein